MQVKFGVNAAMYNFPSDDPITGLGRLNESADALGDADELHARLARDGYLYIPGLIDRQRVLDARRVVLEYMAEHEGLEPGSRPLDGVMGQYGKSVGMMGRKNITHDPIVRSVLEAPEVFEFYATLFGEPARTFDYKWLRAVGHEQFTGCHYDVVYMGRGTMNLRTCWIPFGDLPVEQGVLAVCEGSHNDPAFEKLRQTYGRVDVDRDHIDGWFTRDPQEITQKFGGRWKIADFKAGDIVTFGMYTMHASTTNMTDRWRLSCDVRFQPASEPIDDRWVGDAPQGHQRPAQKPAAPRTMAQARQEWGV